MKYSVFIIMIIIIYSCDINAKKVITIHDNITPIINVEDAAVAYGNIYLIDGQTGYLHIYSEMNGQIVDVIKPDKRFADSLALKSKNSDTEFFTIAEIKERFPEFDEEKSLSFLDFKFNHLIVKSPDSLLLFGQGSSFIISYIDELELYTYFVSIPTFFMKYYDQKISVELFEIKNFDDYDFKLFPQIDVFNEQNDTLQVAAICYRNKQYSTEHINPDFNINYPIIANFDLNGKFISSKLNDRQILNDKNLNTRLIVPVYCSNNRYNIFSANQLNYFIDINSGKIIEFKNMKTKLNYANQTSEEIQMKFEKREPLVDFQIEDIYIDESDNIFVYYITVDLQKSKVKNYIVAKYDLEGNLIKEKEYSKDNNLGISTIKFNKYESNLLIIRRDNDNGTWFVEIEDLF